MKKRLVLITTWFPPVNGVAVNRMEAFVKYFDHSKWEIIVLTIKKEPHFISEEITPHATIYRLENQTFFRLASFHKGHSRFAHYLKVAWNYFVRLVTKNPLQNWMKKVNQKLEELHTHHPIDIIITSSSPIESHLAVAPFLQKYSGEIGRAHS